MRFLVGKLVRTPFDLLALYLCLASLVLCILVAIHAAWNWSLVGDASLMHYVVFLLHSGRAPYSQVVEINLPGSYLLDYLGMSVFGWGAHGLRLYDGFLCLALCCCAYLLGGKNRRDRLFCLAGGMVFVLIHLQDGLYQSGQRDLALATLTLSALALLVSKPEVMPLQIFLYEAIVGCTLTVKPTLALLAFLPLFYLPRGMSSSLFRSWKLLSASLAGLFLPMGAAFFWLRHFGSVHPFLDVMRTIGLLHSQLGKKTIVFLLLHSMAPVSPLFIVWVVVLILNPIRSKAEWVLAFAALCGLLSYLAQRKGFPYQRYPFLAVALILIFSAISRVTVTAGLAKFLGAVVLVLCALFYGPKFAVTAKSFDTVDPFQRALARSLLKFNPTDSIQCLDTYGGCTNTLYTLRIQEATSFLYDCYLFTDQSVVRDNYRKRFIRDFETAQPKYVVLTDERCFDPRKSFNRVQTWPEFSALLDSKYSPASVWADDRSFRPSSRPQIPNSFRIYVRR